MFGRIPWKLLRWARDNGVETLEYRGLKVTFWSPTARLMREIGEGQDAAQLAGLVPPEGLTPEQEEQWRKQQEEDRKFWSS